MIYIYDEEYFENEENDKKTGINCDSYGLFESQFSIFRTSNKIVINKYETKRIVV